MKIDDLFIPKESSAAVADMTDACGPEDVYEDILRQPSVSSHELFDDWQQECIDAGYRHMFEMTIGSARDYLFKQACEDRVWHYYIQKFIDEADLLRSPHSTVFIGASYRHMPYGPHRVRLNPVKYPSICISDGSDNIVPESYSMHMYVCVRFGKYVSEWFRMMRRLWNAYRNEYNDRYSIGLWEHRVSIYPGGNIPRSQRRFHLCETHPMHNFGENMGAVATVMDRDKPFSPSLCECLTKGCRKYMIFDLTPDETETKIRSFLKRYAVIQGEDPYDNPYCHTCFYY